MSTDIEDLQCAASLWRMCFLVACLQHLCQGDGAALALDERTCAAYERILAAREKGEVTEGQALRLLGQQALQADEPAHAAFFRQAAADIRQRRAKRAWNTSEPTDEAYGKATRRLWRQFKQGKLTAEQYRRESIAAFEQWKGAQQVSHEQEPHATITQTPGGWTIEMDNDTWVLLMSALKGAITLEVKDGRGEGDQARQFRVLLTALDRADKTEGL